MPRRSRVESQRRTRARIVDAATRRFLGDGFGTTSLEQVAEEAGFSKGAVYSNFANKTELGLAVVAALYAREGRRLQAALTASTTVDEWFDALAAWAETALGDPEWARLEVELAGSRPRDPALESAISERYATIRAGLATVVEQQSRAVGLELGLAAETAAIGMLAMILGVGIQRAVDPLVPASALADNLRVVVGRSRAGAA